MDEENEGLLGEGLGDTPTPSGTEGDDDLPAHSKDFPPEVNKAIRQAREYRSKVEEMQARIAELEPKARDLDTLADSVRADPRLEAVLRGSKSFDDLVAEARSTSTSVSSDLDSDLAKLESNDPAVAREGLRSLFTRLKAAEEAIPRTREEINAIRAQEQDRNVTTWIKGHLSDVEVSDRQLARVKQIYYSEAVRAKARTDADCEKVLEDVIKDFSFKPRKNSTTAPPSITRGRGGSVAVPKDAPRATVLQRILERDGVLPTG